MNVFQNKFNESSRDVVSYGNKKHFENMKGLGGHLAVVTHVPCNGMAEFASWLSSCPQFPAVQTPRGRGAAAGTVPLSLPQGPALRSLCLASDPLGGYHRKLKEGLAYKRYPFLAVCISVSLSNQ